MSFNPAGQIVDQLLEAVKSASQTLTHTAMTENQSVRAMSAIIGSSDFKKSVDNKEDRRINEMRHNFKTFMESAKKHDAYRVKGLKKLLETLPKKPPPGGTKGERGIIEPPDGENTNLD
jgi:polyhydroxyalkanoate synthesis regulator phasin